MTKEFRYTITFDLSVSLEKDVWEYLSNAPHEEVRRLACSGYVFLKWIDITQQQLNKFGELSGLLKPISRENRKTSTLRFTNPGKYNENSALSKLFLWITSLGIGEARSTFLRKLMLHGYIYESLSQGRNKDFLPKSIEFLAPCNQNINKTEDEKSVDKVKQHFGGLM